jgi:hypothetical protein
VGVWIEIGDSGVSTISSLARSPRIGSNLLLTLMF